MKPGRARSIFTVTVSRRVETTRSWEFQDTDYPDIPGEVRERSGTQVRYLGGNPDVTRAEVWVRPLSVYGVKLNDKMKLTDRDGRVFDVEGAWPEPQGVPQWWKLQVVERTFPEDA